jgi:hypothetical protein
MNTQSFVKNIWKLTIFTVYSLGVTVVLLPDISYKTRIYPEVKPCPIFDVHSIRDNIEEGINDIVLVIKCFAVDCRHSDGDEQYLLPSLLILVLYCNATVFMAKFTKNFRTPPFDYFGKVLNSL